MDCIAYLHRTGPSGLKQIIGSDSEEAPSLAGSRAVSAGVGIWPGDSWKAFLDANAAYILGHMTPLVGRVDQPYPIAYPVFKAWEDDLDVTEKVDSTHGPRRLLALVMSPTVTSSIRTRAEIRARAEVLATAATLLAYQHAHGGAFPATLAAAGISPLSLDPFNGKPLQYQRTSSGAGFVLSSVGSGEPRRPAPSLRYPPTP